MNELENLKNNQDSGGEENSEKNGWGGAREGAGRPEGSVSEEQRTRQEALRHFKRRVQKNMDKLVNAQMSLALGVQMLFRIDEIEDPKTGKKKKQHVLVTDPEEIREALDSDLVNGEDYYYISTDKPDSYSINSLLDRTFGKAVQAVATNEGDLNKILDSLENDFNDEELEALEE